MSPASSLPREIDGYVGKLDRTLAYRRQQRLLQPVRLALHAVDQHAPDFGAVDAPPLEYVSRPAPPRRSSG